MNYGLFSRVISCHDRLAQNCQNSCSKCAPYTQTKALRRRRISSRSSIAQERNRCRVLDVLYADDILLLTPTVSELQNLLNTCERELQALDLVINVKKSCCLRIGPRNDVNCERLSSVWHIPTMDERGQILRHLSRKFKTFQNLYRTF